MALRAIIFVLLPKGRWRGPRRFADRHYYLTVFWTAQFVVLFFYTLTGFWKVYVAIQDLIGGRISTLNFAGFSYIVADRLGQSNSEAVLGNFFSRHELVGWLLFLGTMYIESFSVVIAFRPRLHRVWGMALVLFHVGTQLVLGFAFTQNIVLLGLLFLCSPFTPDRVDVKETLLDLPVLHFAVPPLQSSAKPVISPGASLCSELARPTPFVLRVPSGSRRTSCRMRSASPNGSTGPVPTEPIQPGACRDRIGPAVWPAWPKNGS